ARQEVNGISFGQRTMEVKTTESENRDLDSRFDCRDDRAHDGTPTDAVERNALMIKVWTCLDIIDRARSIFCPHHYVITPCTADVGNVRFQTVAPFKRAFVDREDNSPTAAQDGIEGSRRVQTEFSQVERIGARVIQNSLIRRLAFSRQE